MAVRLNGLPTDSRRCCRPSEETSRLCSHETVRVLIADDELLLGHTLSSHFRSLNYQVVGLARDGEEAVSLAQAQAPDLITMDIRMPQCDGMEATRRIMAECPTCIIILTVFSGHQQEAEEAGAMGYAVKPLFPAQIPGLANSARHRFARYMEIRKAAASPEEALQTWLTVQAAVAKISEKDGCPEEEAAARLKQAAEADGSSLSEAALRVAGKN